MGISLEDLAQVYVQQSPPLLALLGALSSARSRVKSVVRRVNRVLLFREHCRLQQRVLGFKINLRYNQR
jgi:hypothetical protein